MTAYAYVNHGRWVVDCPEPYCAAAYLADSAGVCVECGTGFAVVWPADRDRIDRELARRRVPLTRNWYPGETVDDLTAENYQHGVT